ncbi:hypothetical protein FRZ44_38110 [Hypericibacter terrae]|uniref:PLAT domain-containing protein n=2 Tax=Hypericibacter terrae TaxID=2602015 RepID=A0A5J6MM27_9PROT|nr:hypothetical protein FRZ44_38110 [Hypericibacter terrae]
MDIHNDIKVSRAISPAAAVTDNTAFVSEILDTANFAANELLIATGSLADAGATFTVLLEESAADDMSGANSVADADLIGTEAAASFDQDDDDSTFKLGYRGNKRYIRATITPAGNAGNAFIAAMWVQMNGRTAPQA